MRWTLALSLGLAAMTVAAPATAQTKPRKYTSLIVFGDSLVDAGNIRSLGAGASPAQGYFEGRFTNGYDYTDLLSQRLFGGVTLASRLGGTNFAYGGARASDTTPGTIVRDLNEQIAEYDAYRAGGNAVDRTGLYVLNFGGNDVFAAAAPGTPTGFASDDAFLRNAADAYAKGVQDLNDRGARTILITGFPNATPGPQLDSSVLAEGYLTTALAALNLAGDTTLYRFSYLSFFQRLQSDPGAYGLGEPLILPDATRADRGTCQGAGLPTGCPRYFSFDGVHPTAAVQRALYRDIDAQFALTAGVPEPAAWTMLILGFGAVGSSLRHRRRAVRVAFG